MNTLITNFVSRAFKDGHNVFINGDKVMSIECSNIWLTVTYEDSKDGSTIISKYLIRDSDKIKSGVNKSGEWLVINDNAFTTQWD